MNNRDIEITTREILVGIVIAIVMIAFGFLISTNIHDAVSTNNEKYFKALKIENSPDLFDHAIQTEVGNVVSYGTVKANEPVSDKMIDGEYFSLTKIEEHYVQKTRVVTYTDSNGNTKTRTETYWEWDEVDRDYEETETFSFLGKSFDVGDINFKNSTYIETVKESGGFFPSDVRYKFYGKPVEFNGSLYFKAKNKQIVDPVFHHNETIKQLIESKEKSADTSVTVFWFIWVVVTITAVILFVFLDNRYLNGRKH